MTQRGFPFDAGEGLAYELDWSLMARQWLTDGIIRGVGTELAVFADSTGMQVKIPAGDAWIRGHYYRNDAQVTQAISAANATNPRIDRVVLRIDYAANTIRIAVLTGVAAGSPVAPAVTQNDAIYEYSIATVAVGAAVGTIAAGNVTDTRGYVSGMQSTENNPTFGGHILGDFSNVLHASRLTFQSNVLNGNTNVGIVPNGSSPIGRIYLYGSNTPDSSAYTSVHINGGSGIIDVNRTGSSATIGQLLLRNTGTSLIALHPSLGVSILDVTDPGAGLLRIAGGTSITTGGLNVTGGIIATTGNITLTANNSTVQFRSAGTTTWYVGDGVGASNGSFSLFNVVAGVTRMTLTQAGLLTVAAGIGVTIGGIAVAAGGISFGSAPATTGTIKLPNTDVISWRNAANSADISALSVNASDWIILGNNSSVATAIDSGSTIVMRQGANTRLTINASGGLDVGAATGGPLGAGTVNVATNVYKNGAAYTNPDFLFELWATGSVTKHANEAWQHYSRLIGPRILSLSEVREYVHTNWRFPFIEDKPTGVFTDGNTLGRDDTALALLEQTYIHLFSLDERINRLENIVTRY